jgi:Tfp pilus assembly protein PilN
MIKVNLSTVKPQLDLSDVGGFDLSTANIKGLVLVIILSFIPDFLVLPTWEEEINQKNAEVSSKENELKKLSNKLSQVAVYEKQINDLKTQEDALSKKLSAAKQAIQIKKNPSALLLYVAKNTPKELWINELTVENDRMKISGESLDYNSIGNFVNSLRSSVFIKDASIGNTTSSIEADGKRVESFSVDFSISRYDP